MTDSTGFSNGVIALSYLGLTCDDLDSMQKLLGPVLGTSTSKTDNEMSVRIDEQAQRLSVEKGDANDIQYAGFEVADEAALNKVMQQLKQSGYASKRADAETANKYGVLGLLETADPDGLTVHVVYGVSLRPEQPFVSEAGVKFVTQDQGLGHMVLTVTSMEESRRFYEQGLGFKVSDFVALPMGENSLELTFLHCNKRHHTLALAPLPIPQRLLHFMLQVDSIDSVGLSLGRAKAAGYKISSDLGRHTNDHMLSFYVKSSSGFDIEYGYGARTVSEDWPVGRYHSASIWGHD
ncbi:MAG: VOC family protein [Pseudomonadales bacterium]|nr:VOC family protein [Pseudomonadales bacterium]